MREIKFKGKRIDNGEWVFGYYCFVGHTDLQKHYIIPAFASAFYGVEVDPETVGQYTGLKDKNGVGIYEGDILHNHRGRSENEHLLCHWQEAIDDGNWTMEKPGFRFERINGVGTTIWVSNKDVEVIGDIHTTPELLEVER